jgi:hypothetical protein
MKNFFTLAFIFLMIGSTAVIAQKKDWDRLGSRVVNYGLDRDVIDVGASNGRYTKLKVGVTGGAVNMHKMVVHYANGTTQNIALKHNFSRNSATRLIDLNGNKRFIKKIVFYYDTKNLSRTKAKVHVFGRA